MVFGVKFSGLSAWWLRRTIYLAKLPGLAKKVRVVVGWTLDLFFGKEIEQMITLRDVELLTDRLARLRNKAMTDREDKSGSGAVASSQTPSTDTRAS